MERSTPRRQCGTNDRRSRGVCAGCVQDQQQGQGTHRGVSGGCGSSRGETLLPEHECSALPMAPAINYATVISLNSLSGFTEPSIISATTSIFPHPHDNQAHRHGLHWSTGGFTLP